MALFRVAISNRRLISLDERGVTFRWKDYPYRFPFVITLRQASHNA